MKVSVIYWSGTGNTKAMAEAVAKGAASAGADVEILSVEEADAETGKDGVLLFGCPAMGCEQLEESEFEPYFEGEEKKLAGRKVGLFGSYDWGDGEWMREWRRRVEDDGALLIADCVTANGTPDEAALSECRSLGEIAAKQ